MSQSPMPNNIGRLTLTLLKGESVLIGDRELTVVEINPISRGGYTTFSWGNGNIFYANHDQHYVVSPELAITAKHSGTGRSVRVSFEADRDLKILRMELLNGKPRLTLPVSRTGSPATS